MAKNKTPNAQWKVEIYKGMVRIARAWFATKEEAYAFAAERTEDSTLSSIVTEPSR